MSLPYRSNHLAVVAWYLMTCVHYGESLVAPHSNTTLEVNASNSSVALVTKLLSSTPAISLAILTTTRSGFGDQLESTELHPTNIASTQNESLHFTSATTTVLDLKVPTFFNTSAGNNFLNISASSSVAAAETNSPTPVQTNSTPVQNVTSTAHSTTGSLTSYGLNNETTSRLDGTATQWRNLTTTQPLKVSTTTKPLDSWASKCTVEQYPTEFPISYYSENLECGIPYGQDDWDLGEYEDRCLARWCLMSKLKRERSTFATWKPTFTSGTYVDEVSWLSTVYKKTLTASDEFPIDYYIYMSEGPFTYTLLDVINPIAVLPDRPCCGQCAIQVDQLRIYYWPDFAGEWGTVTSFPSLSIPTGTGKAYPSYTPIKIPDIVETLVETVNGSVTTRVTTWDQDIIVDIIDGVEISSKINRSPTSSFMQKRDIDQYSMPISVVDENGFTFISPSVYIAFTSLAAIDLCGTVGEVPVTTTLALDPNEISTLSYMPHTDRYCPDITFTKPMTWSDLLRDCATIRPGLVYNPDWADNWRFTEDRCHPYIMIPTKLRAEHPEWDSCTASYAGGLHDPPRTLRTGSVLVPTASQPIVTEPAVPGPKPEDPIVTPTQTITKVQGGPQVTSSTRPGRPPNPAVSVIRPPTLIIGTDGVPSPIVSGVQPPPIVINPVPIASGTRPPPIVIDPGLPPLPIGIDPVLITSGVRPPPLLMDPNNTPIPHSPGGRPPTISTARVIEGDFEPGPGNVQTQATSAAPILTWGGITVGVDQGTRVFVDGDVLTPGIAVTIGATTQTLANGVVTTIEGHTFSLDPAGSRLVVDGIRSVDLPSLTAAQGATVVIGGTLITLSNGRSSIIGGITTVASVQVDRGNSIRYAVVVAGTTSYLTPEEVSAIGGHFLGSSTVMIFPVTKSATTVTLFDGEVLIFAPETTFITATVAGGAERLAFLVGGHTFTLRDGRITVLGGKTSTAFLGPQSVAATTTSDEPLDSNKKQGVSTMSTSSLPSTQQERTTARSTGASSEGRRNIQIPCLVRGFLSSIFR